MGIVSDMKGMVYRIRIFDNGYHVTTVKVRAKGQRYVMVNVDNPIMGKKTKLAFMIPTGIRPFVFKGKEMEFNYDIRDSTPLADLTDICPSLIAEFNEDLKVVLPNVIDADFTPFENEEPVNNLELLDSSTPKEPATSEPVKEVIKEKAKAALNVTKDAGSLIKVVAQLGLTEDEERADLVKKVFTLSAKYPKLLYWLPKTAGIEGEVQSIVSAKAIYAVGVSPSYYAAESTAQISEKVLARPNPKKDLWDIVMVGIICCTFIVTLYFIAKMMRVM